MQLAAVAFISCAADGGCGCLALRYDNKQNYPINGLKLLVKKI